MKAYYPIRNGVVIWASKDEKPSEVERDLDRIENQVDTEESYEGGRLKKTRARIPVYLWQWMEYNLSGWEAEGIMTMLKKMGYRKGTPEDFVMEISKSASSQKTARELVAVAKELVAGVSDPLYKSMNKAFIALGKSAAHINSANNLARKNREMRTELAKMEVEMLRLKRRLFHLKEDYLEEQEKDDFEWRM